MKQIRERLDASDQPLIVKPVDGHEGLVSFYSVKMTETFRVSRNPYRQRAVIVAQEYLPEAREGDKRIIMINGESYGAILRIPKDDDNRGDSCWWSCC